MCVPRLPLFPMLGSLASAIQLYSGGMETGLRSPGTTNQQSESRLEGGSWVGKVSLGGVTGGRCGRQPVGWTGEDKVCAGEGRSNGDTLEGL